jgi:hypothetical protein
MTAPHARCSCGRRYETRDAFSLLPFVGVQQVDAEPLYQMILRNCYCGSTIAGEFEVFDAQLGGWALADGVAL